MKVKYSTDNICAFGGLNFTDKLLKTYLQLDVYTIEEGESVIVKFTDGTTLNLWNINTEVVNHINMGLASTPVIQWYAEHRILLNEEELSILLSKPIRKIRTYANSGYDDFDVKQADSQVLMYQCGCLEKTFIQENGI